MARSELAGQRVLVTGAARGIGARTARLAAAGGARLSLVGLEPDRLRTLAGDLDAHWAECDVTDQASLQVAVDSAAAALGGLDAVVANAGVAPMGTVALGRVDAQARTVDVNLTGVVRTASAALPYLVASRGYALLMSSVAAFAAFPGLAAYAAAKAGVEQFAHVLRQETAHLGVRVGTAHPAWVDTDMVRDFEVLPCYVAARAKLPWPLRNVTSVDECARGLVRALQRRPRAVHIPRTMVAVRALRAVAGGRFAEWVTARATGGGAMVVRLEQEIRQLDRNTGSDRVA
jgi:NAD(P)-dependent dehydrogenase (short-subunit alcohol dehydrogenase family)